MGSAEMLQAVQLMLAQMQTQNMDNMAIFAKQQNDMMLAMMQQSRPQGMMTDTRGVGRPINFKGEERKYPEWKAKLMAYLKVTVKESEEWITWASTETDTIDEESIQHNFGTDVAGRAVMEFAVKLYSTLLSCTEEDAFRICHSVKSGNGLEAMRLLVKRFEPRTPGTKRAVLKSIINNPAAKKTEEIEANLMRVEELIKKYEHLANDTLPEDLRVTVIIDLCVKDLKEHLELITKEMTYKEVRDEIISYVERKRDSFGNQLKAMEVDNYEQMGYWGGGDGADEYGYQEHEDHGEMYSFQKGYKGKGKGKNGYNSWGKGGQWNSKGGEGYKGGEWKGKGKGYEPKGKGKGGGGFQGTCFFCGEFGHSQSRCREKDKYMEGVREKGGGKGGAAWSLEEVEEEKTCIGRELLADTVLGGKGDPVDGGEGQELGERQGGEEEGEGDQRHGDEEAEDGEGDQRRGGQPEEAGADHRLRSLRERDRQARGTEVSNETLGGEQGRRHLCRRERHADAEPWREAGQGEDEGGLLLRAEDAGYRRAKAVDECVQNLRRGPPCDVLDRGGRDRRERDGEGHKV
jgi:hypothetical protein